MMRPRRRIRRRAVQGMTLTEVVISLAIGGVLFGGLISGYMQSAARAEWSAYYLAGHALALQRLEAARAAKWDTQAAPPVDLLVSSNFPVLVDVLDVPVAGTNLVYATNTLTVETVSTNPPLKMVRSETVWAFHRRG
ncbi:MAG TPA: prepilin-type N-terminal cleavage/methylation domain-containing protein, partial [Verrucomicrobiota bacterium]|nr:prepilin-type N-terminal cleavage/methylation domain-containing protein [Verrucomicrobiota bacterium]